jgi:hypothetical protein
MNPFPIGRVSESSLSQLATARSRSSPKSRAVRLFPISAPSAWLPARPLNSLRIRLPSPRPGTWFLAPRVGVRSLRRGARRPPRGAVRFDPIAVHPRLVAICYRSCQEPRPITVFTKRSRGADSFSPPRRSPHPSNVACRTPFEVDLALEINKGENVVRSRHNGLSRKLERGSWNQSATAACRLAGRIGCSAYRQFLNL